MIIFSRKKHGIVGETHHFRNIEISQELKIRSLLQKANNHPKSPAQILDLPSRELTYPTLGKGKSSSKCHFGGIC